MNGRVLRELRIRAGLTIVQLAQQTGLAVGTIEAIEKGNRIQLLATTLKALADAFVMDPVDLETRLKEGVDDEEKKEKDPA